MMESLEIGSTPALLSGPESESVFLFVHGLHGNKEESVAFAKVAVLLGYQVLGIDLPLNRKPVEVLPLLCEVRNYLYRNWKRVSIRANSIGAWFSLLSFQERQVEQALFVSPLLDMRKFIEEQPTREEDYYSWVLEHPVNRWNTPTFILRPEVDPVVSDESTRDFIRQHNCHVTLMKEGEHWFHTPEQLSFLRDWERSVIKSPEASCQE